MARSRRLSEQWFQRGLWLVAFAFAACLIGLGSLVIEDLPQVERTLQREDFLDPADVLPLRAAIGTAEQNERTAATRLEGATLRLQAAQKAYANARESFGNWLETRKATSLPEQDGELVARTAALDALKAAEADAQYAVDAQNRTALEARQAEAGAQDRLGDLERAADRRLEAAQARADLRVFGYRLTLTLPLLGVAGWLFRTKRAGSGWPFAWGFIFFALFAFFVELVPYLPSFGGYVQYGVGLLVTLLAGRWIIAAMNRYLARQRLAETQPDTLRRKELDYDAALARLAKGVCPGCERPVDLKGGEAAFCPHCGIGLFNHCPTCAGRKSAFSPYCQACGTAAVVGVPA